MSAIATILSISRLAWKIGSCLSSKIWVYPVYLYSVWKRLPKLYDRTSTPALLSINHHFQQIILIILCSYLSLLFLFAVGWPLLLGILFPSSLASGNKNPSIFGSSWDLLPECRHSRAVVGVARRHRVLAQDTSCFIVVFCEYQGLSFVRADFSHIRVSI